MQAIQTRRLTKTYGAGENAVEVLKGITLDINQGEFVSIMGPSGSGKSTLMHLAGLLDAPTSGGIRVNGQVASKMSSDERALARRKHLGFVFQAFHLIPRSSALQNVMLPMALAGVPRRDRQARARRILESVGLGDKLKNHPSEMSGGQKQRVAIARSLALDPPIILADEPTGNLDSENSADVMQLFTDLHQRGKTIVQVTHDDHMARFGQRIIHFKDGMIHRDVRRGGT